MKSLCLGVVFSPAIWIGNRQLQQMSVTGLMIFPSDENAETDAKTRKRKEKILILTAESPSSQ